MKSSPSPFVCARNTLDKICLSVSCLVLIRLWSTRIYSLDSTLSSILSQQLSNCHVLFCIKFIRVVVFQASDMSETVCNFFYRNFLPLNAKETDCIQKAKKTLNLLLSSSVELILLVKLMRQ